MLWKLIAIFSLCIVESELYEDERCRCVCPPPALVLNNTSKSSKTLYIAFVPRNKCNCDGVILPKVTEEVRLNAQMFCPRCDCKYETRNSTIIMVVVMLVLWMVFLLAFYNIFLLLLETNVPKKYSKVYRVYNAADELEKLLLEGEDLDVY